MELEAHPAEAFVARLGRPTEGRAGPAWPVRRGGLGRAAWTGALLLASLGCPASEGPAERRPGGAATLEIALTRPRRLDLPAPPLDGERRARFHAGRALAHQPWVRAPSVTDARDGLGPLYNARTCLDCHVGGGRGPVPGEEGGWLKATLVRVSLPGPADPRRGVAPVPGYGDQLQTRAVGLARFLPPDARTGLRAEGKARVTWVRSTHAYPDGTRVELRRPELRLEKLGYGPLPAAARLSLRNAPPLHGMGLLDALPGADLLARADPEDADGDGISGRPNRVWDPVRERYGPGRFGWKASEASLRSQIAAALRNDMGLSNPVRPEQPCTAEQIDCLRTPHGEGDDGFEVPDALLGLIEGYQASIGVPPRRRADAPEVVRGRGLFREVGCAGCHVPRWTTGEVPERPWLSNQVIWPYTDLLLHDMGPRLADGRADFDASGREWRTPPLWGLGWAAELHRRGGFLHDGRARTAEEAVLWHGGEAEASRARFEALDADDRAALLAFLESL